MLLTILARLKEPSTYAGVGLLLSVAHVHLSANMISAGITLATALAGIASVILSEGKA